jgi:hypothetical protein
VGSSKQYAYGYPHLYASAGGATVEGEPSGPISEGGHSMITRFHITALMSSRLMAAGTAVPTRVLAS